MPPLNFAEVRSTVRQPKANVGFDMGDNMAGFAGSFPEVLLPGHASDHEVCRGAECGRHRGHGVVLGEEGPQCECTGINCATDGHLLPPPPSNSASAGAVNVSAGRVTFTPSFTYHGFRYVQVEGLSTTYMPTKQDVTGPFCTRPCAGLATCLSDLPVLTGIQHAIAQTQLSNLHFHPTDYPQREKRGWLAMRSSRVGRPR